MAGFKCIAIGSKKANGIAARDCIICGSTLRLDRRKRIVCGAVCGGKLGQIRRFENAAIRNARVCLWCGQRYIRRGDKRGAFKYCGRECQFAATRKPKVEGPKKFARCCVSCGAQFNTNIPNKIRCVETCKPLKSSATCARCGTVFERKYGDKRKRFCSKLCLRRSKKKLHCNYRKRARALGLPYEPINPVKIFDRDGWRCHLCGRKTPQVARGTNRDNAPELDHIVPLSMGGGHLRSNVACACRRCNGLKSNRVLGQPSLFGWASAGGA